MGTISAIFVAEQHGKTQQPQPTAELRAGIGLIGDRHCGADGGVVSLIEAEAVAAFNQSTDLNVNAADIGRNLLTEGIELNPLVGQKFYIGDVELEAFELCEPCATLAAKLATDSVPPKQIVKEFLTSAGIRAYVRSSGEIKVGSTVGHSGD